MPTMDEYSMTHPATPTQYRIQGVSVCPRPYLWYETHVAKEERDRTRPRGSTAAWYERRARVRGRSTRVTGGIDRAAASIDRARHTQHTNEQTDKWRLCAARARDRRTENAEKSEKSEKIEKIEKSEKGRWNRILSMRIARIDRSIDE
jgi:hypothetical protein